MSTRREACITIFSHDESSEADDLWRPERRSSDWIIGDAPPEEPESADRELALEATVTLTPAERVWGLLSQRRGAVRRA